MAVTSRLTASALLPADRTVARQFSCARGADLARWRVLPADAGAGHAPSGRVVPAHRDALRASAQAARLPTRRGLRSSAADPLAQLGLPSRRCRAITGVSQGTDAAPKAWQSAPTRFAGWWPGFRRSGQHGPAPRSSVPRSHHVEASGTSPVCARAWDGWVWSAADCLKRAWQRRRWSLPWLRFHGDAAGEFEQARITDGWSGLPCCTG